MPYHLAGWAQNVDGAGAEADMNAITDTAGFPRVSNTTDLLVDSRYRFLAGFYAGIDNTVAPRCRLKSPSLDANYGTDQSWIPWINSSATPAVPASPFPFNDWRASPLELQANEAVKYKTRNDPAAAIDQVGIGMFADGPIQPVDPKGSFWVRGTLNAAATVSLQWALRTWTPDSNLPAGKYDFLDMKLVDAAIICGRLVFPSQAWRPGVIGLSTETVIPSRNVEMPGQWGLLGNASTLNLPAVELLTTGAINRSQVVYMSVRKTSDQA